MKTLQTGSITQHVFAATLFLLLMLPDTSYCTSWGFVGLALHICASVIGINSLLMTFRVTWPLLTTNSEAA
jgi:hypothetical protein